MSTIKCVVVGDSGVGKKLLLQSYVTYHIPDYFPDGPTKPPYTLEVNIRDKLYTVNLFSTANAGIRSRPLSYPDTHVFIVCFSVVNPESFENVKKWILEIDQFCPNIPYLIVGTQTDLRSDANTLIELSKNNLKPIEIKEAEISSKKLKAAKYIEYSALTEKGFKNVFDEAFSTALKPAQPKKEKLIRFHCPLRPCILFLLSKISKKNKNMN